MRACPPAIAISALLLMVGCKTTSKRVTEPNPVVETKSVSKTVPRTDPGALAAAHDHGIQGVVDAVAAARERAVGWTTLPDDDDWRTIIDPDRAPSGSLSFGTVSRGVLLNAAELSFEGEGHSIIERHRKRKTRWGTEELVNLIRDAGLSVKIAAGGAPLRVGNLSRERGGDIPWSSSHNSGRDADLAFYNVDVTSTESVPAPDLLRFDDNGVPDGRTDLTFDVPRNWKLVEALLQQDEVNVQWIFVSLALKAMLLEHARSSGAAPEIIERAESILHQPTDAPPHADHFHLRIGCSKEDRLDGCLDYGPRWEWYDWHRTELLARSLAVSKAFDEGTPPERIRALDFLDEIKSPFAADVAAVFGLWDEDPAVREKAMDVAYGQFGWTANALVQIQKYLASGSAVGPHMWKAYNILRRSRDPLARDFAIERVRELELPVDERRHAARALSHFMEPELVPELISELPRQDPAVRAEVAEVLRRITNRSEPIDWTSASPESVSNAVASWRAWWMENHTKQREAWLAAGFRDVGLDMPEAPEPRHVDALLALFKTAPSYVVYNANRTVKNLTGRWAPLEQDDGGRLHDYWYDWWQKNRERLLAGQLELKKGS